MKREEFVERLTNMLLFDAGTVISHVSGVIDEGDGLLVVNLADGSSYFLNVTSNQGGEVNDR